MKKGSLTIFVALIMVFVMTLMFTMAELVRVYALAGISRTVTDGAVESGFSEYNSLLWENYRILGIDLCFGAEEADTSVLADKIKKYASNNASPEGHSLERLEVNASKVKNYAFLTDDNGAGVLAQGIKVAKNQLGPDAIEALLEERNLTSTKQGSPDDKINAAKKELKDTEVSEEYEKGELEDNPLDVFDTLKELIAGGILKIIIPEAEEISDKRIGLIERPSERELKEGTWEEKESINRADKILYGQYLIDYYSYYGESKDREGLNYEIEYIIAGKKSDKENLAATAKKILLIREGINAAYIATNPGKMSQVTSAATTLSGGFAPLTAIIEPALIGAWAYIESLLEVRTLFSGGSISYIKTDGSWNSDLFHLSKSLQAGAKAKEVKNGISYKGYLRCLVAAENTKKLGIRTCDVLENELSLSEDYKAVRLDNCIYRSEVTINYEAKPLFLSIFKVDGQSVDGYSFSRTKEITY